MITLCARQQKRHRCIEQSFGLCGRGRGWDDLGEWHWSMYIIICEVDRRSRFFFLLYQFFIFFILKSLILTCVPKHEPPSHLPSHSISVGHPHAPAPSMLYSASDIDWQFNSYMIVYMLQCHSPKSSHPLPLPQSPKVCSIHLCLFCCLAHRVISTIFLNSIYMCQYTVLVFFFLAYFTLYNRLQFHPSHQN